MKKKNSEQWSLKLHYVRVQTIQFRTRMKKLRCHFNHSIALWIHFSSVWRNRSCRMYFTINVHSSQALAEARDYLLQLSSLRMRTEKDREEVEGHLFAPVSDGIVWWGLLHNEWRRSIVSNYRLLFLVLYEFPDVLGRTFGLSITRSLTRSCGKCQSNFLGAVGKVRKPNHVKPVKPQQYSKSLFNQTRWLTNYDS